MIPQNTFVILKTLQKDDLKKLNNFINSPYHNTNKALITLFNELNKFHPQYSNPKLTYEYLYKKLYPENKFSDRTIKNRLTEFSQLLRNFLAQERLKKSPRINEKLLIQELQKRRSFVLSNKNVQWSKKRNSENPKICPDFFLHQYDMEELFHYNSLQLSDVQKYEKIGFSARKAAPLIAFFFSTYFVHLSEHITYNQTTNFNNSDNNNILDEFAKSFDSKAFMNYLEKTDDKYFIYIKAYYLTYKIKIDKDVTGVYRELKKIFIDHASEFEETDTYMLWAVLGETLYLKLIPQDVAHYRREVFELNDYFLKLNIYPARNEEYFTTQVFENIFAAAIICNEYEWSENFIIKYGQMLHPETRENQVNYCLGVLNFKLKKYEKSLEHIGKVNYSDIIMKINLRFYTLLNYIEMKHYESALSLIDSSKHFSSSNEKIPKFLLGHINTSLRVFKRIILAEAGVKELDYTVLEEAKKAQRFFQKSYAMEKMKVIFEKQERNFSHFKG